MICLSSIREYRQAFIKFYKDYTGYQTRGQVQLRGSSIRLPRKHSLLDWLSAIPPGNFCPGGKISAIRSQRVVSIPSVLKIRERFNFKISNYKY